MTLPKNTLKAVINHLGPGNHPGTGTSQDVHGGGGSIHARRAKALKKYKNTYPEVNFRYEKEQYYFMLGGEKCTAGAVYNRSRREIVFYPAGYNENSEEPSKRTIAHEYQHHKYNHLKERRAAEYEEIKKIYLETGKNPLHPDGSVRSEYFGEFPAYEVYHYTLNNYDFQKRLIESGGVSDYSKDWWAQAEKRGWDSRALDSAINETLAEAAKLITVDNREDLVPGPWFDLWQEMDQAYSWEEDRYPKEFWNR